MKKRFSEVQIIRVLKEAGAGAKTGDLCRRHGISEGTSITGRPSSAEWAYRTRMVVANLIISKDYERN